MLFLAYAWYLFLFSCLVGQRYSDWGPGVLLSSPGNNGLLRTMKEFREQSGEGSGKQNGKKSRVVPDKNNDKNNAKSNDKSNDIASKSIVTVSVSTASTKPKTSTRESSSVAIASTKPKTSTTVSMRKPIVQPAIPLTLKSSTLNRTSTASAPRGSSSTSSAPLAASEETPHDPASDARLCTFPKSQQVHGDQCSDAFKVQFGRNNSSYCNYI